MATERTITITSADALFKEFYGSGNDQSLINALTPLASILMKNKKADWVGDEFVQPVRFGSAVGLGYRAVGENLPQSGAAPRGKARFSAKRAYATCSFDREAIKASRNDRGAFAKVTVDEVEATEEGFALHMIERALFGDGSGKLGEVEDIDSGAGTEASPWLLDLTTTGTNAPKYKKNYFPEGARLELYTSGGVYQCTVQVLYADATNVAVKLVASGNVSTPVAGDLLYWEGNKDGECVGFGQIAPVSAGTLYGISQILKPNFKGLVKPISGAIDFGDINDLVSEIEQEIMSPNLAVGSHRALAILKSQAEDQKRYSAAEVKSSDLRLGFKGLEIMSDNGAFPMIASSMCPDDEIVFLNTKYNQLVMREDFGWFDDDGTILMRDGNKDVLNSRYGGYFEHFCSKPNTVARVRGFTTT